MSRTWKPTLQEFTLPPEERRRLNEKGVLKTFQRDAGCALSGVKGFTGTYPSKVNRTFTMTSATTSALYTGGACYRIEDSVIDEDCWIAKIPFDDNELALIYKIHHACYPDRTLSQTHEFKSGLIQSGISTAASLPHQSTKESGNIDELSPKERRCFDYAEQQMALYIQKKKKSH